MRLTGVTLQNFRQFHGTQSFSFSHSEDKTVTVFFGANGSGKTALLNAFVWCLYGESTPAFERPELIISHRAVNEVGVGEQVVGRVTVEFEHQGREYTVRRSIRAEKQETGGLLYRDPTLEVRFIDEGGETRTPRNPQQVIEQTLPERLYNFFFFDGERIEELAKPDAYEEIEDGIKSILGITVVERSIRHLGGEVTRRFEKSFREKGQANIEDILNRLDSAREEMTRKEEEKNEQEDNLHALKEEQKAVNRRLRNVEDASELQERREERESERRTVESNIRTEKENLNDLLSERGHLAFVEGLLHKIDGLLEDKRRKGEIPSGIKRQFVLELLEKGTCICGTELVEGETAYENMLFWRERAGLADAEAAWLSTQGEAKNFRGRREELIGRLDDHITNLTEFRRKRKRINEELDEIKEKIDTEGSEEAKDLEARRDKLSEAVAETNRVIGGLERDLKEVRERIGELEDERDEAEAEDEAARQAQRRVRVCNEAVRVLKKVYELRVDEVREALSAQIRDTYDEISFKPYMPQLTEDFHLELRAVGSEEDRVVAASTGENQLLSLSFVSGVAALARTRYEQSKDGGSGLGISFEGEIFPMVMDSPFGNLDTSYKREVARAIPRLAPQTVVFVSKSQGLGPVYEEIEPFVGRKYVIEYETPKTTAEEETLSLGGKEVPYIRHSQDGHECAYLREI